MRPLFSTALIAVCLLCGCGSMGTPGNLSATPSPSPSPGIPALPVWTWIGGSNLANQSGSYGSLGTAVPSNVPSGRYGAATWKDPAGNLWLFGGLAAPTSTSNTYFSDLWRYSNSLWTWVAGPSKTNQPGIYGTEGVAAPGNNPGARAEAVTWVDKSGNLWMFGGVGLDANGNSDSLNDLWEFKGGEWIWIGGPAVALMNQPGIYGTQGVPSPGNLPGPRSYASWADQSGNFWLYGGLGNDSTGAWGILSDLWEYSGSQWIWISGWNVLNQPAVYGIQGVASASATPGPLFEAASWTDAAGNFWLFGGSPGTVGQNGQPAVFHVQNDLWKYSGGQWTWVSGSSVNDQPGSYGTEGIAAVGNTPGARVNPVEWTDSAGNFWIFGGSGRDGTGGWGDLNDVWRFNSEQWAWMGGSSRIDQPSIYGTLDSAAAQNTPGARWSAASWIDGSGRFLLFGGLGSDSAGTAGYMNDMWWLQLPH